MRTGEGDPERRASGNQTGNALGTAGTPRTLPEKRGIANRKRPDTVDAVPRETVSTVAAAKS